MIERLGSRLQTFDSLTALHDDRVALFPCPPLSYYIETPCGAQNINN